MEKTILIVDDEPCILESLERLRRSTHKPEWDFIYAENGFKALELLSQTPVDVVISDMYMSEMDGMTLLKTVMGLYPEKIRILLSGASCKNCSDRSSIVDQFGEKPLNLKTLDALIEQAYFNHNRGQEKGSF